MTTRSAVSFALTALCLFASIGSSTATAQETETTTLHLGSTPAGHPTVVINVGEFGPYNLILDTGASHTAIALPMAMEVGFTPSETSMSDVQALDTVFVAEEFQMPTVAVNGHPIGEVHSIVLPAEGEEPLNYMGFLATNALGVDRYRLDFGADQLILNSAAPEHQDGVFSTERGLIYAEARIGNRRARIRVMIDTGSPRTFVNARMRNMLPDRGTRITFNTRGVEQVRPTATRAVTLRSLRVGGACFDTVPALFANLDIFRSLGWLDEPAIILGMDAMQYLNLVVDRENGIVELSPSSEENFCRRPRVQFSGVLTPSMP
ncbi:aspartyl protease family protein [Maricaulis sp.]|uniref:aspartyl protease family protein n=2 Tax=unclassified Maricaulis TaxID=2632371 RepID=UPI001B20F924|nr:aspartyl protease family protein [Maricaulis sp.]MBO6797590.1 aspartyl protease family protein [Maricaulis sp.]